MKWKTGLICASLCTAVMMLPLMNSNAGSINQTRQMITQNVPAQNSDKETERDAQPKNKLKGRLPNNYGKIGVTSEQRQKIYKIQAKYRDQMEVLQKQLQDLRKQRDAEVHGVLTDKQKKLLSDLSSKSSKAATDDK